MPSQNERVILWIRDILGTSYKEATMIYSKSHIGGEFIDHDAAEVWFEQRFKPNLVWIDEDGYTAMCIDALKILSLTAATDFGSSRQRDFGQHWGDMTRGYLAEYAFAIFLQSNWDMTVQLGHEVGDIEQYLSSDVQGVKLDSASAFRDPNIALSIKGTKWNGIWLDIPGAQFAHSDAHILVKVGVERDHLFAFFKHISVFRDKILHKGVEVGALAQNEADQLFDNLPTFRPIPAYVSGFAERDAEYSALSYSGKKGRKHYKVRGWRGPMNPDQLLEIAKREQLPADGKAEFEGIGTFKHSGYLFNVGNLKWSKSDWEKAIIKRI